MNINIKLIIFVCLLFSSCAQKDQVKSVENNSHKNGCNCDVCNSIYKSFSEMKPTELYRTKIRLSNQIKDDFRSWKPNEPERWEYLAQKFADEVIEVNSMTNLKRDDIANVFINYITQRSELLESKSNNKKNLRQKIEAEFQFNLSYEIGIVEFNNWQKTTEAKFLHYKQVQDSLKSLLIVQKEKNKQIKQIKQ